jgi:DNA-binding response OmpR family regulator
MALVRIVIRFGAAREAIAHRCRVGNVAGRKTSVLVVDMEADARAMVQKQLKEDRFYVSAVATPEQALGFASRLSFDLLITDVFLPGLSGRDLADKISETQTAIKVLFMSSYSRAVLLHSRFCPMGSALIMKPFTPAELCKKVEMVLLYHRRWKDHVAPRAQSLVEPEGYPIPLDDCETTEPLP